MALAELGLSSGSSTSLRPEAPCCKGDHNTIGSVLLVKRFFLRPRGLPRLPSYHSPYSIPSIIKSILATQPVTGLHLKATVTYLVAATPTDPSFPFVVFLFFHFYLSIRLHGRRFMEFLTDLLSLFPFDCIEHLFL